MNDRLSLNAPVPSWPKWVQAFVNGVAAGIVMLVCAAPRPATAGEIAVTSTAGSRGGPDCTLRDAITAADLDMPTGGCPAGHGADTIVLVPGAIYVLDHVDNVTIDDGVAQPNGLPSITTPITIVGDRAIIERSHGDLPPTGLVGQTPAFRLLHVTAGGQLALNGLTMSGGMISRAADARDQHAGGAGGGIFNAGTLILTGVNLIDNGADERGGGIYNAAGAIATLIDTKVTDSGQCSVVGGVCPGTPWDGGAIDNAGILTASRSVFMNNVTKGLGGAIENTGTLTLIDCILRENRTCSGGAIHNTGITTLNRCVATDNAVEGAGGAILNDSGAILAVRDSVLVGNTASDDGGAIYTYGATMLIDCTLRENAAFSGGGGGGAIINGGTLALAGCTLEGNVAESGGGMRNFGTSTLTNCTLSGNRAGEGGGGGIDNMGVLLVTYGTLSGNDARLGAGAIANADQRGATTTVDNTLIGPNTTDPEYGNCAGRILGSGHNLSTDSTCGSDPAFMVTEAFVAPLADYGGPTRTIALCTGVGVPVPSCIGRSPAIDTGNDVDLVLQENIPTDQRGLARRSGEHVDIGAFEVQQSPFAACVGDCNGDGRVTINEIVTLVDVILGLTGERACMAGAEGATTGITIANVITAVNNALRGCGVG